MTNKNLATIGVAVVAALTTALRAQCPGERVIPPVLWVLGQYGGAVQIEGDVAIAADPVDHTISYSAGAVHAFRRVDGRWMFEATKFHSRAAPYDGFGDAVSLDGSQRFAASAPGASVVEIQTGAVYIFEYDGEAWREVAEIPPTEPMWSRGFGSSLVLRGDTLVVGQPKDNVAWAYRETGGRWEFAQKLEPPDPRQGAKFGNALALDGEWLVVGAPWEDAVVRYAGAVYLYRRDSEGHFTLVQELRVADPGPTEEFGSALAIEESRLAVGALSSDGGAVWVFELAGAQWQHDTTLHHDDPLWSDRDGLGWSIALRDDTIVAGAPRHSIPGVSYGAAYAFRRQPNGSWRQAAKLLPAAHSSGFGRAVATDGVSAIVGAPDETVGSGTLSGAAHIFDLGCLLCRADLDGDGELTFFDFVTFQNLFAAGDMTADFDGSGALDFFDFLAFQNAFAAGCA